jgi:hypothetical protein
MIHTVGLEKGGQSNRSNIDEVSSALIVIRLIFILFIYCTEYARL